METHFELPTERPVSQVDVGQFFATHVVQVDERLPSGVSPSHRNLVPRVRMAGVSGMPCTLPPTNPPHPAALCPNTQRPSVLLRPCPVVPVSGALRCPGPCLAAPRARRFWAVLPRGLSLPLTCQMAARAGFEPETPDSVVRDALGLHSECVGYPLARSWISILLPLECVKRERLDDGGAVMGSRVK